MACVHDTIFERARREQAQLNFDSCKGMNCVGSAYRCYADFAETDASDLTLFDQLGQGFHGRFDRNCEVDPLHFSVPSVVLDFAEKLTLPTQTRRSAWYKLISQVLDRRRSGCLQRRLMVRSHGCKHL